MEKDTEIAASKRKGIVHLDKAKPSEFIRLARETMQSGKLENVKFSLKVDGAGIRFGKDSDGRFFFETSRSGIIRQKNAFTAFASQKEGANLTRAAHYDEMYNYLEECGIWKQLPKDTKIIAEVLYNPMAEVLKDGLRFVSITYDKAKLGSLMTIVPLDVVSASTGESVLNGNAIISQLIKKSTAEIKIMSANLNTVSLNVAAILEPLFVLDDIDQVITSRKNSDKMKKELYQYVLNDVKIQLSKFIINHPEIKGKNKFGDDIEGLVLDVNDAKFKITSPEYKHLKFKG